MKGIRLDHAFNISSFKIKFWSKLVTMRSVFLLDLWLLGQSFFPNVTYTFVKIAEDKSYVEEKHKVLPK